MDNEEFGGLRAYLDGVAGGSCTLPFDRMRELTGQPLPDAATSETWWTDPAGWDAWPPSSALRAAGWRIESAHPAALLVRLARDRRNAADARAAGRTRRRWPDRSAKP